MTNYAYNEGIGYYAYKISIWNTIEHMGKLKMSYLLRAKLQNIDSGNPVDFH